MRETVLFELESQKQRLIAETDSVKLISEDLSRRQSEIATAERNLNQRVAEMTHRQTEFDVVAEVLSC